MRSSAAVPPSGTNQKEPATRDKYTLFAPFYDLLSGEYPVYHAGRVLGVDALTPAPGQQVLVRLDPRSIAARIRQGVGAAVSDAALATYSLSLTGDWEQARTNMTGLLATPLARLACALGGSDITAAPWWAVEERCIDVVRVSARGGHLQIRGKVDARQITAAATFTSRLCGGAMHR